MKLENDIFSLESKSQLTNNNINNINSSVPEENNSKKNQLNNNNTKIKNIKAQSYKTKSDQGYNYDAIKEKYESFLKPKEEKEPNIQSKVFSSMLSSKEELNNNNMIGIHNKSLVKNIQEKIKILKNNKNKNKIEYNNYINEIDECYSKIKQKEEKDNLKLQRYYVDLTLKEKEKYNNENNSNRNVKKIEEKYVIKNNNKEKEINYIDSLVNSNNNNKNNENIKKTFIHKSKRLENIMRNLANNKRYNYYDYHCLSNKIRKSRSKDKENININTKHSAPDINLIVDESYDENIKIIDEGEFTKLRKKNLRSTRLLNANSKRDINKNLSYRNQMSERSNGYYTNYYKYVSPRLLLKEITHKIMPPNQL